MKVLITRNIPHNGIEKLKKISGLDIDLRSGPPLTEEEMKTAIKDCDAAIVVIPDKITKEVLDFGSKLKLIACYSVGFDHVDIDYAKSKNIYVSNTPGDLTESVAEHSFTLMMGVAKHIVEADFFVRDGHYKYWDPLIFLGPKMMGKTLGIVGFGRIGQHFARMAKYGLNMNILYTDTREIPKDSSGVDATRVGLEELLTQSDIVSLHCNLSAETKYLINAKTLRLMKPYSILINTSRGPVVDEDALTEALKNNWIAGAGLDVFEEEPKVNSELIKLPNVILTPHIASATREARIQMADMAVENVINVLVNKKEPINWVNK